MHAAGPCRDQAWHNQSPDEPTRHNQTTEVTHCIADTQTPPNTALSDNYAKQDTPRHFLVYEPTTLASHRRHQNCSKTHTNALAHLVLMQPRTVAYLQKHTLRAGAFLRCKGCQFGYKGELVEADPSRAGQIHNPKHRCLGSLSTDRRKDARHGPPTDPREGHRTLEGHWTLEGRRTQEGHRRRLPRPAVHHAC